MNRIFWGTLVCAALCACSKDHPADNGKPVFLGDEAYLNVNIADASSLTRATSGDSDFEYGKDEHNVTDADFYFYDENGVLIPVTVIEAGPCVVTDVKTSVRHAGEGMERRKGQ